MEPIHPGAMIGVLGGGQLGRMFAMAAQHMGYRVIVWSPESDAPAGQVSFLHIDAEYDNTEALECFTDRVEVATIEFENIPVPTLAAISQRVPVRPGPKVLQTIQNRLDEKSFLDGGDFPVATFQAMRSREDLESVAAEQLPAVLKTASSGYDGKGQRMVSTKEQLSEAWEWFGEVECVLEAFIEFECEFSVLVARNGPQTVHYAPVLNTHHNHILDISRSPSGLSQDVQDRAVQIARGVAESLDYVGVLCVEFFLQRDGQVLINEIAPRPHNSGHLSIEAHVTSQFEQQVRAVCGLPLGSTDQLRPAAMANLLGDVWHEDQHPDWSKALENSGVALHLYGKSDPRTGRKMGHLTCLGESADDAVGTANTVRQALAESAKMHASAEQIDHARSPESPVQNK